jgi:hypothetical protein
VLDLEDLVAGVWAGWLIWGIWMVVEMGEMWHERCTFIFFVGLPITPCLFVTLVGFFSPSQHGQVSSLSRCVEITTTISTNPDAVKL